MTRGRTQAYLITTALSSGNAPFYVYGRPTALARFFDDLPNPADIDFTQTKVVEYKSATVRRWPGDTGYQRPAGTRRILTNRGRSRQTLPGVPFTVEYRIVQVGLGVGIRYRTRVEQFTTDGTFRDLVKWAENQAKVGFILRSAGGQPVPIKKNLWQIPDFPVLTDG